MITDRRRYGVAWRPALVARVRAAARAGVQLVQVRERDLDGGPLLTLVRECLAAVQGTATRVVVNDRLDVALAAEAHGVHLPGEAVPAHKVRSLAPRPFLVGRSVHTVQEAERVCTGGDLDYLVFGSVFETTSKRDRAPAGLAALAAVAGAVPLPVLAVGGITVERVEEVCRAGAAGAAAIALFAETSAETMRLVVTNMNAAIDTPGTVP
jgi:thiamine-phosphate diphosphorylase